MIESPTIMILNGPSGSGKSTTQKAIQRCARLPYLRLGIDNLFDTIVPDHLNLGSAPQGGFAEADVRTLRHDVTPDGHAVLPLSVGPIGRRAVWGMHRAVAAFARAGNHVVMDYILYEQAWLVDLAGVLAPYRAYLFGLDIALEEVERRERERGTSPSGHARSHHAAVHAGVPYDMRVDVNVATPEGIARELLAYVDSHPRPRGLRSVLGDEES